MDPWQEDRMNALLGIESEHELFKQLADVAAGMGFDYCAYGIRMPVPISRPSVAMFNNYPQQWQSRYDECEYIRVDPTVHHALKSTLPVIWSSKLFEAVPAMWEEARAHGLHAGWAQASRDASGSVGLLTLARSSRQLDDGELTANMGRMVWLAQYAHAAMARLLISKLTPETQVSLTAREKEVLRWTAEGKTAYEISQILAISERTICFHINNVVSKLGASNKTQAAVKAAALGMLS